MKFSPQQERALQAVSSWLAKPDRPWFYLAGYAGTGKTTLAREFASGVGGSVCYGAYTGKAAYVLQQKGCVGATTIHRLIYKPKDQSRERLRELQERFEHLVHELTCEARIGYPGDHHNPEIKQSVDSHPEVVKLRAEIAAEEQNIKRPSFTLNLESEIKRASLVIIDECSMIDSRMAEDLLSFEVPILVLGDPAQLPPVRGEGYFTSRSPDFLLTEIHRQAKDNPIIRLATDVREGRGLSLGKYGDSVVMSVRDADPSLYTSHDQLLVGRNRTRRGCNRRIREIRGRTGDLPVKGDRLVCLRNNHELGLLNGGLWEVHEAQVVDSDEVCLTLRSEDQNAQEVTTCAHAAYFVGQEPPYYEIKERDCFDFGYALTVHKSQGSQWRSVLVVDESPTFRSSERAWLYTAITRASERVTIVQ